MQLSPFLFIISLFSGSHYTTTALLTNRSHSKQANKTTLRKVFVDHGLFSGSDIHSKNAEVSHVPTIVGRNVLRLVVPLPAAVWALYLPHAAWATTSAITNDATSALFDLATSISKVSTMEAPLDGTYVTHTPDAVTWVVLLGILYTLQNLFYKFMAWW